MFSLYPCNSQICSTFVSVRKNVCLFFSCLCIQQWAQYLFLLHPSSAEHGWHPAERVHQGHLLTEGPWERVEDKNPGQSLSSLFWVDNLHSCGSKGRKTNKEETILTDTFLKIFQLLELPTEMDRLELNQAMLVNKRVLLINTLTNNSIRDKEDYRQVIF